LPKTGRPFADGFNVLIVDGSVRFVARSTDETTCAALITADGGEVVGPID